MFCVSKHDLNCICEPPTPVNNFRIWLFLAYFDLEFGFFCPRKPSDPTFGGKKCKLYKC